MSAEDGLVGRVEIEFQPGAMVRIRVLGARSDRFSTPRENQELLDAASVAIYYERLDLMKISQRAENALRVKNFVRNLDAIRWREREKGS